MGYREEYRQANEEVRERYALVMERIFELRSEHHVEEKYWPYFRRLADIFVMVDETLAEEERGGLEHRDLSACEERSWQFYYELQEGNYDRCFANPTVAVELLGAEFGQMLCFLYTELRAAIPYAFEGRRRDITILCELFVQIYNCFESEQGADPGEIRQIIYWFFHDYSELFVEQSVREMLDPSLDFFTKIVMESDLTDLSYLYRYGEYISSSELLVAEYLNALSEEQIQAMADTYTEGYRIGFEVTGKDLGKKGTVDVRYPIGFERMVRAAIRNFEKMGLRPVIYRDSINSMGNRGNGKKGCTVKSVNRQFDYDHKSDRAFYLDKAFVERRLEVLRTSYEKYKDLAAVYAGPAVIETFGEEPFSPENKAASLAYTDKQQELNVYHASASAQIIDQYIKGEERSFTIIAYPIPAIGRHFKEIFARTVEINTLDYMKYRAMQQKMIDVLDLADYVRVKGKGSNRTDLTVKIHPLADPGRQTAFENCVADVNIPVGEVFTSPLLTGTQGILHVTRVFLNELEYKDFWLRFENGMVTDYGCANFASEEENRKYIKDNVLHHHDSLPLGEFAIGTNTTAYVAARKYGIEDKMPILIAEKTGPHFAVGDTCYSHAENVRVYNPDGKEIIAKDNEVSVLRDTDVSKAYFQCHTDITIPYDELGELSVLTGDGEKIIIIQNGQFVLSGCEELNRAMEKQ